MWIRHGASGRRPTAGANNGASAGELRGGLFEHLPGDKDLI